MKKITGRGAPRGGRGSRPRHRHSVVRAGLIIVGVIVLVLGVAGLSAYETIEHKVHECEGCGPLSGVAATVINPEPTANVKSIPISGELERVLQQAASEHRSVAIDTINGDGTASRQTVDLTPKLSNGTILKVASRANQVTAEKISQISSDLNANGPSVRGQALFLGLEHLQVDTSAPIFIISSLLDTSDPLDFRKLGFDVAPSEVVKTLKAADELPDLENADITILVRPVAGKQTDLRPPQRDYLKAVWRQVLVASGARRVRFDFVDGTTPISTVTSPTVPIPAPPSTLVPVDPKTGNCHLDTSAYFASDSARLLAAAATKAALKRCVAGISPTNIVTVTGWTAGADPNNQIAIRLSKQRAQAIANLLEQLGVAHRQLVVRGYGNQRRPIANNPYDPRNRTVLVAITK
jgi:outer membrane protein OmpA-like peptidoglycan-associated protein